MLLLSSQEKSLSTIQSLGLQTPHSYPNNREVKIFVHMTVALAFVPKADVMVTFQRVKRDAPACLDDFMEYFKNTYVGVAAKGRGAAKQPRYSIDLWNQYEAVRADLDTTNNMSEEWHNRFRIVVAKYHPHLYAALN